MQINIDETKKIKKFLFFKSVNASKPNMSLILTFSEEAFDGGVLGNVKLNKPKIKEAIDDIKKVFFNIPSRTLSFVSQ